MSSKLDGFVAGYEKAFKALSKSRREEIKILVKKLESLLITLQCNPDGYNLDYLINVFKGVFSLLLSLEREPSIAGEEEISLALCQAALEGIETAVCRSLDRKT